PAAGPATPRRSTAGRPLEGGGKYRPMITVSREGGEGRSSTSLDSTGRGVGIGCSAGSTGASFGRCRHRQIAPVATRQDRRTNSGTIGQLLDGGGVGGRRAGIFAGRAALKTDPSGRRSSMAPLSVTAPVGSTL